MPGAVHERFDLSDVGVEHPPIDKLDSLLDVVAGVLDEHGPAPGNTRLERMSRWLALNLAGAPYGPAGSSGQVQVFALDDGAQVCRIGPCIAIAFPELPHAAPVGNARALAVALLRANELAEVTE